MAEQLPAAAESTDSPVSQWRTERHAISREIHDEIAHSLLALQCKLQLLGAHQDSWAPGAWRLFSDATSAAASTLEQLRGLAARLRDPADPDISDNAATAPAAVPADAGEELFYVLREATLNALSHAHARSVVVDVQQSPGWLRMLVEDDGEGFEPDQLPAHLRVGLTSMRERMALVGGRLHIDSVLHSGTRVSIDVPCSASARSRG
jgi:signal transduction histidine kinase